MTTITVNSRIRNNARGGGFALPCRGVSAGC